MRMRTGNRKRKTLLATLQEVRKTKEGVEEEGGCEEHENLWRKQEGLILYDDFESRINRLEYTCRRVKTD